MKIDKPVQVLLVEDDEVAIMGIERALKKAELDNPLIVARDGVEALQILRGHDDTEALERPYIILLDLNMPRMNGHEFLEELRGDEALHDAVVLVLTTSDEADDKRAAYDKFVAGYILKSKSGRDYRGLTDLLTPYWRVVDLPS